MMGNRNVPFADASECVAASSMGDLPAAVPAEPFVVAAPAAVVVSCACMDIHSLYRQSFELVLVWTCMNYQCLYGLVSTTFGLVCIAIYEMIVTFDANIYELPVMLI